MKTIRWQNVALISFALAGLWALGFGVGAWSVVCQPDCRQAWTINPWAWSPDRLAGGFLTGLVFAGASTLLTLVISAALAAFLGRFRVKRVPLILLTLGIIVLALAWLVGVHAAVRNNGAPAF